MGDTIQISLKNIKILKETTKQQLSKYMKVIAASTISPFLWMAMHTFLWRNSLVNKYEDFLTIHIY